MRVALTLSQIKELRSDVIETFVTCDAAPTIKAYGITNATKYVLGAARPISKGDWVIYLLSKEAFHLPTGCTIGDIVWLNNQYEMLVAFGGDQVVSIQDTQLKQLRKKERDRHLHIKQVQETNSKPQHHQEKKRRDEAQKWHENQTVLRAAQAKEKQRLEEEKLARERQQEKALRERYEQQAQERILREQEWKRKEQERQERIKQERTLQPTAAKGGEGCVVVILSLLLSSISLLGVSLSLVRHLLLLLNR